MRKVYARLRAKLLAGIVVIVPVVATIVALRFLFRSLDSLLGPWIAALVGRRVPGLGLLATLLIVFFAGVLATNFAGRRLLVTVERLFTDVPLVRRIYSASKDIVESATAARRQVFGDVVMVEYPRKGVHSYGFVTSYTTFVDGASAKRQANVFVPGPPVPTSGNLVAVPVEELVYLHLSVEEALKLIFSAGLASPPELRRRAIEDGSSSGRATNSQG